MTKFKVGDRVRSLRSISDNAYKGRTETVTEIGWDDNLYLSNLFGCWTPDNWELVSHATPHHIVAAVRGGRPAPSYCPFVHNDRDSAVKEAERLAAANVGVEFAVYERVTARVADKPVVRAV